MRDMAKDGAHDLDPDDWPEFRRSAHAMLDDLIDHIQAIRSRPTWQPAPPATRDRFARPLPRDGAPLDSVLADAREHVLPYATGNLHPRFMGWVHGAGTPVGLVGEMIAAGLDMNCGGRDHIGIEIERQVTRWMAEAFAFPQAASGVFVTGTSMANFLALIIARTEAAGAAVRRDGVATAATLLTAYASAEAHGCIAQAMELAGLGSASLRRIATDSTHRMDPDALAAAIAADHKAGRQPFLVVATAGSVNTGAIDRLDRIADICRDAGLWFHVDGAFGALAAFSSELKPLIAGIERSDSIAFDFHKWGHVPYDAGFLLVRDGDKHRRAFASSTAYLQRAERGLAAGETWPCDLGPDLSRGARALKTWLTIETLGTDRIGAAMSANCRAARHLAGLVEASRLFELKAPVALNIVCFGLRGSGQGAGNRELVMDLQEAGVAAPSWTTIGGEDIIRCAIVNHRTTVADVEHVMARLTDLAETRLAAS